MHVVDKYLRKTFWVLAVFGAGLSQSSFGFPQESIDVIAGPGMIFVNPYGAGFTINAGIGVRVSQTATSALFVGADLGVGFLGDLSGFAVTAAGVESTSINNTGATAIQLLPTVYYRTRVSDSTRAFIGMSMGPNVFVQSLPAGAQATGSTTKLFFEFLIRPGVELSVSHQVSFVFEPKVGVLRSSFAFLPQLSTLIAF